jgi:hypothetical protein
MTLHDLPLPLLLLLPLLRLLLLEPPAFGSATSILESFLGRPIFLCTPPIPDETVAVAVAAAEAEAMAVIVVGVAYACAYFLDDNDVNFVDEFSAAVFADLESESDMALAGLHNRDAVLLVE